MKRMAVRLAPALSVGILLALLTGCTNPSVVPPLDGEPANRSIEETNGHFLVVNEEDGTEIAVIPYGRSVTVENLMIGGSGEPLRLRIELFGGGKGHIDVLTLDGRPPEALYGAAGTTPVRAADIAGRLDNDIIEVAPAVTAEFTASSGVLALGGRIEPGFIPHWPFRFPPENTHTAVTPGSAFYQYSPKKTPEAVFREYLRPSTGHPDGIATAEAHSDGGDLIVEIDFTSDNTEDGSDDYASLYVRGPDSVEEFTLRTTDPTWGGVEFIRTDEAEYRHKYYTFIVPFEELERRGIDTSAPLELSFALYGTVAAQAFPSNSWDPTRERFAASYTTGMEIHVQFISSNGTVVDTTTLASSNASNYINSISYAPTADRYLVAWRDTGTGNIAGRILDGDGTDLSGSDITLQTVDTDYVANLQVLYDPVGDRFLLVWEQDNEVTFELFHKFISTSGTPGSEPAGADATDSTLLNPNAAYDPGSGKALVVYQIGDDPPEIEGGFIDQSGSFGDTVTLCTNGFGVDNPFTAFDYRRERFFAVWNHTPSDSPDAVYGRFVNPDGTTSGNIFLVAEHVNSDLNNPVLSYGYWIDSYLLGWNYYDADLETEEIGGVYLDGNGAAVGSHRILSPADGFDYQNPAASYNLTTFNFLVSSYRNTTPYVSHTTTDPYPPAVPVFPEDGATDVDADAARLIFSEPAVPSGQSVTYDIYVGTDEEFTGVTPIEVNPLTLSGLGLLGAALVTSRRRRRRPSRPVRLLTAVILCAALFLAAGCPGASLLPDPDTGEIAYDLDGLEPGTQYYWKVISNFSGGLSSISETQTFTTKP